MATKFYLRDATLPDTVGPTLPGASNLAGKTITTTATGADTNRFMTQAIGTAQTSAAVTTAASTSPQISWFRRWVSRPLAPQTIAAQTVTIVFGASESAAQSDMLENGAWFLCLWDPRSGTNVGTLVDDTAAMTEPGTGETNISKGLTSTVRTCVGGVVLVLELFSAQSQTNATARTNTIFYDGTTEDSTTNNAARLVFTNDIVMESRQQPSIYQDPAVL